MVFGGTVDLRMGKTMGLAVLKMDGWFGRNRSKKKSWPSLSISQSGCVGGQLAVIFRWPAGNKEPMVVVKRVYKVGG